MLAYTTLNKMCFLNTRIEIIKQFIGNGEENDINEVYTKSNLSIMLIAPDDYVLQVGQIRLTIKLVYHSL